MPNVNSGWSQIDYDRVIKLLEDASTGYGIPVEVKRYGCFEKDPSFENPRDVVIYLEGLRGNELDDRSYQYWHSAASEDVRKQGQPVDAQDIYKHVLTDKKRYDQEHIRIFPPEHRQITGTDKHTIRIIKNLVADGGEILGERIDFVEPTAIREEGRIEITYKFV